MEEELELQLEEARDLMGKALEHTQKALNKIRAGKAHPSMLEGIMVNYYGMQTPLYQVANINTPEARQLAIKPFEEGMIQTVEKAIAESDLGLTPQNDGETVRINLPPMTEERRKDIVKRVKNETENGRISVRNARKEVMDELKKLQKEGVSEDEVKRAEEQVQKLTDEHIGKIDKIAEQKEEELMSI